MNNNVIVSTESPSDGNKCEPWQPCATVLGVVAATMLLGGVGAAIYFLAIDE